MKRLIALTVLLCLLLCACGQSKKSAGTTPTTEPVTEPATESIPETQAPTEEVTEPTQPQTEPVTVYLLTKATYFDSGHTEYRYDENYNLDSYTVYTLEGEVMYEMFFEQKDANGMACVVRSQWPEGAGNDSRELTYLESGKLSEEQVSGSNYTGYQYAYDETGNRTEKREYYEGILQSAAYYTYENGLLTGAYGEDSQGNKIFECRVENGLILEKVFLDTEEKYGYLYEYDENNNLVSCAFYQGSETMPGDQYTYEAVEVDAQRAQYLLQQQKYLIYIA